MRYKKHLLAMSIALALGASGSAFAVNNGDFEDPDGPAGTVPTGWVPTDATAVGINDFVTPHGGNWYLAMGFAATGEIGGSESATGTAGEDLTGCSPYDLGEWAAAGFYQTFEDDTASFRVDFSDLAYKEKGGLANVDGWAEVTDSGNIGEMATSATVTVGGTAVSEDQDGAADAIWDDISFTADCVTDYAKISGKVKLPTRDEEASNGVFQRGWVSFDGAFAHLESGKLVGDLSWNDKSAMVTCDAVPDPADFFLYGTDIPAPNSNYEAVYAITYSCSEGTDGKALFFFDVDGGSTHGGKNKDKFDRGCWKLSNYETEGSPDFFELYECLDRGNVNVMPPPAP